MRCCELPAIGGPSLSSSYLGMFIVFMYMWLPFMILPIAGGARACAGASLLQASADLGARPGADVPHRDPAAGVPGPRCRLDLHVLADARRLHHPAARRRAGLFHRHDGVSAAGHRREHPAGRGLLGGARSCIIASIWRSRSDWERSMRSERDGHVDSTRAAGGSRVAA